ncbi:MAG: IclR family transcriptional regulator C-terminal domain-containing protein [Burkholderiales bacterium]|nr:IclR family transcriptional regulator C-terminal domain-containing protein [Burkholderiales bacterium]MDP2399371.1 IclR family transcriptional regulator C-terminal domain-containing protein [Burkholderiales bacterium]
MTIRKSEVNTKSIKKTERQATERRSDSFVESFAKGLSVIRSFDPQNRRMTLSQVAERCGLTRAAARRILLTLLELGYVAQEDRMFVLTPRILDLGYSYLSSMPLAHFAQPIMIELGARLNQSCSVATLDGTEVVYLLRVPKRNLLNTPGISLAGMRLPAFSSSMGRIMLSALPDDELKAQLDRSDLRSFTPRTIWRRPALEKEIQKCGKQGYSLIIDELEVGLSAVAMPIVDASGRTIAAMNISCNSSSVRRQDLLEQILPELRAAVHHLNGILSINIK